MSDVKHDFSGIGPECDCPAEPYRHRHVGGSQPVAEADEVMRERLREAIGHRYGPVDALTAELLPTVRALIADELRAAADHDSVSSRGLCAPGIADLRVVKTGDLRARADEMDPR